MLDPSRRCWAVQPQPVDSRPSVNLAGEVEAHASRLRERVLRLPELQSEQESVLEVACRYLGCSLVDSGASLAALATEAGFPASSIARAADLVRRHAEFRVYTWEWIRAGRPALAPTVAVVVAAAESAVEDTRTVTPRPSRSRSRPSRPERGFLGRLVDRFRPSWTGSGTVSYYDKDSSPD